MEISKTGKAGRKPKSIYLEVGVWRGRGTGIHLTAKDPTVKFHVVVRQDRAKASGHPYLWRELDRCLKQNGR